MATLSTGLSIAGHRFSREMFRRGGADSQSRGGAGKGSLKWQRLPSQKQDKPLHAIRFLERVGTYSSDDRGVVFERRWPGTESNRRGRPFGARPGKLGVTSESQNNPVSTNGVIFRSISQFVTSKTLTSHLEQVIVILNSDNGDILNLPQKQLLHQRNQIEVRRATQLTFLPCSKVRTD